MENLETLQSRLDERKNRQISLWVSDMIYGYLGIHDENKDFMKLNDYGCDSIVKEVDSSQRELKALVKRLKKDDKILILLPQNLGSNLNVLVNYVNRIMKKEADVVCVGSGWLDTQDPAKREILTSLIDTQEAQKKIRRRK